MCPYSRTHEIETNQWQNPQKQALFEFIKDTSRGHEFWPYYRVKKHQVLRGYKRFRESNVNRYPLKRSDAFPHEIDDWEDYFRIEVARPSDDVDRIRQLKKESIAFLVDLFPLWRSAETSFQEDQAIELRASAETYVKVYLEMRKRLMQGDFTALSNSQVDTLVVEAMLHYEKESIDLVNQMQTVKEFFQSPYFTEVPYEFISTELFAVLKKRVKQGHYKNSAKAMERLSGFFYDVEFIAAYAPYCDAMVIDKAMLDFVNDQDLRLAERYGTRFFSRSNWSEFLAYLRSLKSKKTWDIEWALKAVHP